MSVLIVEDEARLAALIRRTPLRRGHAVDVVGEGEAALTWTVGATEVIGTASDQED